MHETRKTLKAFVGNELRAEDRDRAQKHVELCEFCSDYVENLRLFKGFHEESAAVPLPSRAIRVRDRLFFEALRSTVIELRPLRDERDPGPHLMAADGRKETQPEIQGLSSFFSEDPELVLRIMRNNRTGQDYLELIGEEPALISGVLIDAPELHREFITDEKGRADISDVQVKNYDDVKWRIKMPDAVFSLERLTYDPDQTEHSEEVILETETGNKIRVRLEDKREGKQISIEILELDHKSEFGEVQIAVPQAREAVIQTVASGRSAMFTLTDMDAKIEIRLFTK